MTISSNNSNISSMLKKAYNTENNSTVSSTQLKETETATADESSQVNSSAAVYLGQNNLSTGTYTAQGLLQQVRQYQLKNTALVFSDDGESENTWLDTQTSDASSSEIESMSQDWTGTISKDPSKAAVMVENTKSSTLNTIFSRS